MTRNEKRETRAEKRRLEPAAGRREFAEASPAWRRYDGARQRLLLTVHVQPNARRNACAGLHGDALKVKIAAPAVDNQANAALIEFLSAALEVSRSALSIRAGMTGRRKSIEIAGGPALLAGIDKLSTGAATGA